MNKTYEAPQAQFISLAATETMATSAEYYDDDIGLGGGTGSNPFD